MRDDVTRSLFGVLVLAGLLSASCSDVVPTGPTESPRAQPLSLAAEPAQVTPEFLPPNDVVCAGARPFRTRFVLVLGGIGGFVLQDLRVGFTDPFGVISVPAVVGASRLGSMNGSLPPNPLPTSTPIPFPTTGPNTGLIPSTSISERLPVILEFGCHVRPHGTIVVTAGTRDRGGRRGDHRLTIDVGE
jgi:hypothetical protein